MCGCSRFRNKNIAAPFFCSGFFVDVVVVLLIIFYFIFLLLQDKEGMIQPTSSFDFDCTFALNFVLWLFRYYRCEFILVCIRFSFQFYRGYQFSSLYVLYQHIHTHKLGLSLTLRTFVRCALVVVQPLHVSQYAMHVLDGYVCSCTFNNSKVQMSALKTCLLTHQVKSVCKSNLKIILSR